MRMIVWMMARDPLGMVLSILRGEKHNEPMRLQYIYGFLDCYILMEAIKELRTYKQIESKVLEEKKKYRLLKAAGTRESFMRNYNRIHQECLENFLLWKDKEYKVNHEATLLLALQYVCMGYLNLARDWIEEKPMVENEYLMEYASWTIHPMNMTQMQLYEAVYCIASRWKRTTMPPRAHYSRLKRHFLFLKARLATMTRKSRREWEENLNGTKKWVKENDHKRCSLRYTIDVLMMILVFERDLYLLEKLSSLEQISFVGGIPPDEFSVGEFSFGTIKASLDSYVHSCFADNNNKLERATLANFVCEDIMAVGEDIRYGFTHGGVVPSEKSALVLHSYSPVTVFQITLIGKESNDDKIFGESKGLLRSLLLLYQFDILCRSAGLEFSQLCLKRLETPVKKFTSFPQIYLHGIDIYFVNQRTVYKFFDMMDALSFWLLYVFSNGMRLSTKRQHYDLTEVADQLGLLEVEGIHRDKRVKLIQY